MKKQDKKFVLTIIISVFVGSLAMYAAFYFLPIGGNTIINKSEKEVTVTDSGIADAVEKLYDAVVVVESYKNKQVISAGSGFVYKKDNKNAYIATNNHVIDGATDVYVTFTNGKSEKATIVGKDEYSDMAVLSVDADKIISVAQLGNSTKTRLGDTVFAIGAPISTVYYGTVTRGVLSGKDRMVEVSIKTTGDYVIRAIQTDAAINSGNSGGPLANSNGEVIGITSMKLVSTSVEGIGFAIPIEDVLVYADQIEKGKEMVRPFLGISMVELDDLYNLYLLDIDVPNGAYGVAVAEISEKSPAEEAGLKIGDIIYKVGDVDVKSIAELRYYLYKYSPGDTVEISYARGETPKTAKIKLVKATN